jgi:ricin-type beta-trefoil lectin protein
MHVLPRRIGAALAGVTAAAALAVPMAQQADAASSIVRLHTQANTDRSLSNVSGLAFMPFTSSTDDRQRWIKTDKAFGFAELRNLADQTKCLDRRPLTNGGSLVGKLVMVRTCDGSINQQWKVGVSGDLQHRASGQIAEVDLANINQAVRMGGIPNGQLRPEQKWHVHPA